MHITTEVPTCTAPTKQFRAEPSWQDKIMQQVTEAMVDGASETALDLLYYIHGRMVRTPPGERCTVTFDEFQSHEATHCGIPAAQCQEAWNSLDWRHAFAHTGE